MVLSVSIQIWEQILSLKGSIQWGGRWGLDYLIWKYIVSPIEKAK